MNYREKLINDFEKKIDKELDKIGKIENKEEKMYKLDVLYKMHKVLSNYEELEPLFIEYFEDKTRKDKFKKENKGEER